MKSMNDFFNEKLGFVPFQVEGFIDIRDDVDVKLIDRKNDQFELYLKKFLSRILKKQVSVSLYSNKEPEYLCENWLHLIVGHEIENYLRMFSPEFDTERKSIAFKTHSQFAIERLKKESDEIESLILRNLGNECKYYFKLDETLTPEFKKSPSSNYNSHNYQSQSYSQPQAQQQSGGSKAEDNPIIIGRPFKRLPMPIAHIPLNEGSLVAAKGKVFYKEYDDKRRIVQLFVTDYSDSFVLKSFNDNAEALNSKVNPGDVILFEGKLSYDNFAKDFVIFPYNIMRDSFEDRMDDAEEKRVELHVHSKMSSMDGTLEVKDIVKTLAKWGHKAAAITDHGVVQTIPEFYENAEGKGMKSIFAIEAFIVDDFINIINIYGENKNVDEVDYVVFDFETTGLQPAVDEIIEIGAYKVEKGEVTDKFHKLVKPSKPITEITTNLTGITNEMLEDAGNIKDILPEFLDFIEGSILVAHNANFDYRFLREWVFKVNGEHFERTYLDTLSMSKSLLNMSGYSLDKVVDALKLGSFQHHRADEDAYVTALAFTKLLELAQKQRGVKNFADLEGLKKFIDYKSIRPYHALIYVKNRTGLRNLYELVSNAHLKYFYRIPRILKSELLKLRDGLLLSTAGCEEGELTEAFFRGATKSELTEIAKVYDLIEICPVDSLEFRDDVTPDRLIDMYRTLYDISKELNIIPFMSSNAHYLNERDKIYRDVLRTFDDKQVHDSARHLRTTKEMMKAAMRIFNNEAIAREVVITNTNLIAEQIEHIQPLTKRLNPPSIEGAEDTVRNLTMDTAYKMYGDPLPEIVLKRVERELNSIIKHGYAVLYLIAHKIVKKSNDDGYLVGSRGSVGSSVVATMMYITEVNALPPHYVCPNCKYSEFITDGSIASGFDLGDKNCPKCGISMKKNGQDIPFETFMGFEGDKVPDIDLNFSGEYQGTAHKYVEEMFGEGHVFRAGTIGTVADKMAIGYVRNYAEKTMKTFKQCEVKRIAEGVQGTKRTTGQHPGGLMIVPRERDMFEFSPIQHPANDMKSDIVTTHFAYEFLHDDIIKLDALGHDDPTFIRMLTDITGITPDQIPMDDRDTISIFSSTKVLKIDLKSELDSTVGSFGIPEFGTQFVRRMLEETKPSSFAELVRISGLSHGTDVWTGNARDLVVAGVCTLKEVIACRDDIMNYLIQKGVPPKTSFKIMEKVRKGKGLAPEDEDIMKQNNVPDWYIGSCKKIKYLFPKAHAAAYVSMAFRIAWFKVHHPLAFYATFFSVKGDEFPIKVILAGKESIKRRIMELRMEEPDPKKKNEIAVLELALEMLLRGFKFFNVDLYKSHSHKFIIEDNGLIIPFIKVTALGDTAAKSVIEARQNSPFLSQEDLLKRTALNKSNIDTLKDMGVLKGIPERNQMNMFGM